MSNFQKIYGNLKLFFGGSKIIEISQDGTNSKVKGSDPFIFENVQEIQFSVKTLKGYLVVDITIEVADWSGGITCTKTVTGVTPTSVNQFSIESIADGDVWGAAKVYATGQDTDEITFTCETTPTDSINLKVAICLI